MLAQPCDLTGNGKAGRHEKTELDAPHRLGTLFHEIVVALAAGAQQLHGVAHLQQHDGQHERDHHQRGQIQLHRADSYEGIRVVRKGPEAAACIVGRQQGRRGGEGGAPARRQAKRRQNRQRQQHERQIENRGNAARRGGEHPNRHAHQRNADRRRFRRRRPRSGYLRNSPANRPGHEDGRDAQRAQPIPRPPQLPFTQVACGLERTRRAEGAEHRADRRADGHRREELQHMPHPGNFRRRHEPAGHQSADHGIEGIGEDVGPESPPFKVIGTHTIDDEFGGDLHSQDPDPIAARREPQRHEQQARGRPKGGQVL